MPNPHMTREEREAFLADVHVGVLSVAEAGRGPCTVPVWYSYRPGEAVRITATPTSRKMRLMQAEGRATLCAQTETLPYKYVTVEGRVEIVQTDVKADQRAIAHRYLGEKLGDRYLESKSMDLTHEALLLLHPERWWSVDFSKMQL